jgi:hypothetical protein
MGVGSATKSISIVDILYNLMIGSVIPSPMLLHMRLKAAAAAGVAGNGSESLYA